MDKQAGSETTAQWIAANPCRFRVSGVALYRGTPRVVSAIAVRRKIGHVTGNVLNVYEYYITTQGLSAPDAYFTVAS